MTISSWWPRAPRRGPVAGRKFLAPPYYSQRAAFASLWWALFHHPPHLWAFSNIYVKLHYLCHSILSLITWRGSVYTNWKKIILCNIVEYSSLKLPYAIKKIFVTLKVIVRNWLTFCASFITLATLMTIHRWRSFRDQRWSDANKCLIYWFIVWWRRWYHGLDKIITSHQWSYAIELENLTVCLCACQHRKVDDIILVLRVCYQFFDTVGWAASGR